ncbi:MAG: helix-turn-helix domain-containing protein [Bacteroidales bacterium]|nr:helix-turn-helix domain-containing protein [Bacteroidales bacterium]
MKLSEKIYIIRKARGYSQEGLGLSMSRVNKNGISRQTISDWENGNCEPVLENIRDLAEVLGVSFDALLDESIDLSDKKVLNSVLKNISPETKEKVNNSYRYRIFEYRISWADYLIVILYFVFLLAFALLTYFGFTQSSDEWNITGTVSATMLGGTVLMLYLPIFEIKKIKNGGMNHTFGTLSQTHFVIIGWSDNEFDRTIYVPIEEIEKMEVVGGGNPRHGKVKVTLINRARPIITSEIINPGKLVDFFNNKESFVDNEYGK